MPQPIQVEGFYVNFKGDRSACISDQEWTITGGFTFECDENLHVFKNKILEAFEFCSDDPISIETFEDRTEMVTKELVSIEKYHMNQLSEDNSAYEKET